MATSWNDIPFGIRLDQDGARPMPARATFGSVRHVANGRHDIAQYTGVGNQTFTMDIYLEADDYDDLSDAYNSMPRTSETFLIDDVDQGDFFLDTLSDPRILLNGKIMCSIILREHH